MRFGCTDTGITKFEFVAKIQFLYFFRLSGLPISENRESRRSGTERGVELSTIQRTPEEIRPVSHTPPPAYDDIFPKEYVYNINATNSSSE